MNNLFVPMTQEFSFTQNIEELKEYFKNLGIEYRFSCYYENNAEGCDLLGDFLESIERDFKKAAKVYHDNCENNKFPMSCCKFGVYKLKGFADIEKNAKEAADYFYRSCTYGNGNKFGCYYSGQMLAATDPDIKPYVKQDIKTALKHLEKGCYLGCADSCFAASSFYFFGNEGCEQNMKKAFEMSLKGCELDHIQSCSNLSHMYFHGKGVEKNDELGKKYKKKARDMINSIKNAKVIEMQRVG